MNIFVNGLHGSSALFMIGTFLGDWQLLVKQFFDFTEAKPML